MSTSLYLRFTDANGQTALSSGRTENGTTVTPVTTSIDANSSQFFKIQSFNTNVENKATVGSATSGAGGGKIEFKTLNILRKTDAASALLFRNCAAGMHYKQVELYVTDQTNQILVKYFFRTVFTVNIGWSDADEEGAMETISFSYGSLVLSAGQQASDGKITGGPSYGWNQIKNVAEIA